MALPLSVCAAGIVRLAIFAQTRSFTLAQIMAYFTDITCIRPSSLQIRFL
jgi:hypothetical protein